MLRISKLTDYGIVLLAHFAEAPPETTLNAREMAEATSLPFPVVSKMLKALAGASLLESQRGARGGYRLARDPGRVTVAEIISAIEGPIAVTECTAGPGHCEQESQCGVREPWQRINRAVLKALEGVTLAELVDPAAARPALLGIQRAPTADGDAPRPSR